MPTRKSGKTQPGAEEGILGEPNSAKLKCVVQLTEEPLLVLALGFFGILGDLLHKDTKQVYCATQFILRLTEGAASAKKETDNGWKMECSGAECGCLLS